jgi:hypothetical protein
MGRTTYEAMAGALPIYRLDLVSSTAFNNGIIGLQYR